VAAVNQSAVNQSAGRPDGRSQDLPDQAPAHFVQELGLDVERGEDIWRGEASVPSGACATGTRFPLASVLICYVDVIAGSHARTFSLPQLSVTVDMSLDIVVPDPAEVTVEEVSLSSRILRAGKRLIVTETILGTTEGETLAVCTSSFSVVSRTVSALGDLGPPPPRHERRLLSVPLAERVGLVCAQPGGAEIARRPGLGNTTDSLMGGLTALAAEAAALSAADAEASASHMADRLHVRFLDPVRIGPARAEAHLLGRGDRRRLARVEVGDAALPGSLTADVTVSCAPIR
jgi:acyl-coenzyme A thioesterase PaaI-like protein